MPRVGMSALQLDCQNQVATMLGHSKPTCRNH